MLIETTTTTTTAADVACRLLDARTAYDAAAADPETDFSPLQDELDAALDAYVRFECQTTDDLADLAEALWERCRAEWREIEGYAPDAVGPLAEFTPIADAVTREMSRLLPRGLQMTEQMIEDVLMSYLDR